MVIPFLIAFSVYLHERSMGVRKILPYKVCIVVMRWKVQEQGGSTRFFNVDTIQDKIFENRAQNTKTTHSGI